jgi:uridine phosphorylase
VIEPAKVIKPRNVPKHCVICFFNEVISRVVRREKAKVAAKLRSEIGTHPLYEIRVGSRRLGIFHPGVCAPLAAAFLEELIALGYRLFIVCGGAGVLDRKLTFGHVVLPSQAVRDEGTSYHYLKAGRLVTAHPRAVSALKSVLEEHGVPYVIGKTWTTDGVYRETPAKVRLRRREGCLTVEMEAAAFFAVAGFRKVVLGQMLCCGDDVSGAEWDRREWFSRKDIRERLFWLAAEACLIL